MLGASGWALVARAPGDHYARAFPAGHQVLFADVCEARGQNDFAARLKFLIPDDAQAEAFLAKGRKRILRTTYRIDCRT
jgi:hypothetical protein